VIPCMWMPWEGFTFDGREKPPPILHFPVLSGLLSSISMFIATFNLFNMMDNSRFVVRRRIRACSWEMVDWVLYEVSTSAALVSFLSFWLIQFPTSSMQIHLIRVQGVMVHSLIVCIDFVFTTPYFLKSHVFLALLWPSFWLALQFVWIMADHQPTCEAVNFYTWSSPLFALAMLWITIAAFFLLKQLATRLRSTPATATDIDLKGEFMKSAIAVDRSEIEITPHQKTNPLNSTSANFELMARSQRAEASPLRPSTQSTDSESGVYRIGSIASIASNISDDTHVIAMGSWADDHPHVHDERRSSVALMPIGRPSHGSSRHGSTRPGSTRFR
jgi:hypothetical protein